MGRLQRPVVLLFIVFKLLSNIIMSVQNECVLDSGPNPSSWVGSGYVRLGKLKTVTTTHGQATSLASLPNLMENVGSKLLFSIIIKRLLHFYWVWYL